MTPFGKTIDKVLNGTKTATSHLVKQQRGHSLPYEVSRSHRDGTIYLVGDVVYQGAEWDDIRIRPRYAVGKDYAIQPGRGQKSVGRYRITAIERYDVRTITPEQVKAEGFGDKWEFLKVWTSMHDPSVRFIDCHIDGASPWISAVDDQIIAHTDAPLADRIIAARPAARYDAWYITFEVVEVYA
jgi:uncharacterized protein YhfF